MLRPSTGSQVGDTAPRSRVTRLRRFRRQIIVGARIWRIALSGQPEVATFAFCELLRRFVARAKLPRTVVVTADLDSPDQALAVAALATLCDASGRTARALGHSSDLAHAARLRHRGSRGSFMYAPGAETKFLRLLERHPTKRVALMILGTLADEYFAVRAAGARFSIVVNRALSLVLSEFPAAEGFARAFLAEGSAPHVRGLRAHLDTLGSEMGVRSQMIGRSLVHVRWLASQERSEHAIRQASRASSVANVARLPALREALRGFSRKARAQSMAEKLKALARNARSASLRGSVWPGVLCALDATRHLLQGGHVSSSALMRLSRVAMKWGVRSRTLDQAEATACVLGLGRSGQIAAARGRNSRLWELETEALAHANRFSDCARRIATARGHLSAASDPIERLDVQSAAAILRALEFPHSCTPTHQSSWTRDLERGPLRRPRATS